MKKIILVLFVAVFICGLPLHAEELKAGMKASDWSFKDAEGKMYTMESWAGKVLLVNYTDPDFKDLNEHFTDAMKKAKDEGLLKEETYKGIGIADCASSWKPDFLIKSFGASKAKKYKTIILFDYDAALRNAWGLAKDTANAVLLDKNRICRAIVRGRVPDEQVQSLVQMAIDLQDE